MSEVLVKIQWSCDCSTDSIYYDDGYADHLYFLADSADLFEPSYEVIRDGADRKQGRTVSPRKTAVKTYRLRTVATESVADTLQMISLADSVILTLPDGTAISDLTGDDVNFSITQTQFIKIQNITLFSVELQFTTDAIIKSGCCSNDESITPPDPSTEFPTITTITNTGSTAELTGTCPTNYFVRAYFKELLSDKSWPAANVKTISVYNATSGWCGTIDDKIYKTTNAFGNNTLQYTAPAAFDKLLAVSDQICIAIGQSGDTYRTGNGGGSWSVINVGAVIDLYGICSHGNNVYACGTNGAIFKSTNGGGSWSVSLAPTSLTSENINSISLWNTGGVDYLIAVGDNGVVLRSSNSGGSWNLATIGADNFQDVCHYGSLDAIIIASNVIKYTNNGGSTFNAITHSMGAIYHCAYTQYGVLCTGNAGAAALVELTGFTSMPVYDGSTSEVRDLTVYAGELFASADDKILLTSHDYTIGDSTDENTYETATLDTIVPVIPRTYVFKVRAFVHGIEGNFSTFKIANVV